MNLGTFVCTSLAMMSCLVASAAQLHRQTEALAHDRVLVKIFLQTPRVSLHEPVLVTLQIRNNGQSPAEVDLGRDRKENFLVAITLPTGEKIQPPQLRRSGFTRIGEVEVGVGDEYSQSIVLNEWYDFRDTGLYEIEVKLAKPAMVNGEVAGGERSLHQQLEIEPRNPQRLTMTCKDLVAGIEGSTSYESMVVDAVALSYVNDPVAVPYLQEILGAN